MHDLELLENVVTGSEGLVFDPGEEFYGIVVSIEKEDQGHRDQKTLAAKHCCEEVELLHHFVIGGLLGQGRE